ncbi:TetR/AcrR family transcriptional regulator [Roseivirga misakiensis]|uniref:HTH tetR-type domain-containing protein n=1 Tax=Roseivirga misakiensis TaxID=1563681 RepID=A0A1E5SYE5_9BACT|nr:TetR/AcrR family transcriptional regulator [Roseivirga misakiensis]OEK04154.1 hypothetical protein BFP71_11755 [Roseivirga misakiensis]
MRPQKVKDEHLMRGLISVLRAKGYEGASLMDLANATGLKKASLYHRFPGGKQQMVEEVLKFIGNWSEEHIYGVLTNKQLNIEERLLRSIANINALYDDGKSACILKALTSDANLLNLDSQIKQSFQRWIEGFEILGVDAGFTKDQSIQYAQEVIIRIQGSLILSKGLNSTAPFQEQLGQIKTLYSKASPIH